ncbi:hypothetical protein [Embleya sp. NPDC050493]|uniref:hypothetical protein n=1 Tax=Embleya sp. NPDC050493 TaxID=3363989 RepID=UPI0037B21A75
MINRISVRRRRRVVIVVAGAVAIQVGLGAGAFAAWDTAGSGKDSAGPRTCTGRPNPDAPEAGEERSCFSVDAGVDHPLAVGETATVRFEVRSQFAAGKVRVEADLPANLAWLEAPVGLTRSTHPSPNPVHLGSIERAATVRTFKAGQSTTYTGRIVAKAAGPAEIKVRAAADLRTGVDAAEDLIPLTVGAAPGRSSLGAERSTDSDSVEVPADVAPQESTPHLAAESLSTAGLPAPAGDDPVVPRARTAAAAATACATGKWLYVDEKGVTKPVVNMTVEAWDADTSNAHDLLASGLTGTKGEYKLCFDNAESNNSGQDVYVKLTTANKNWRVQATGTTNAFSFTTPTVANVANGSTTAFGNRKPTQANRMRALHAFDALNDAWKWVPGNTCWDALDTTCRQVVVNWAPDSTIGNYFGNKQIHLKADAPDSHMTVVHELTHALMADVYEDYAPPIPNCSPHGVSAKSSTGCAWVEGFAEWVPASVYKDPYYRWPSGSSLNLETPTWSTSGWDDGDAVEGRVAGALIDLTDTTNEGSDVYGEAAPGNVWNTFLRHRSATFAEFWQHRKADGYDTSANGPLKSLYQSTIDY